MLRKRLCNIQSVGLSSLLHRFSYSMQISSTGPIFASSCGALCLFPSIFFFGSCHRLCYLGEITLLHFIVSHYFCRREAAIPYARFWSIYRLVVFICTASIAVGDGGQAPAECGYIFTGNPPHIYSTRQLFYSVRFVSTDSCGFTYGVRCCIADSLLILDSQLHCCGDIALHTGLLFYACVHPVVLYKALLHDSR
jgi:hypothetical protein